MNDLEQTLARLIQRFYKEMRSQTFYDKEDYTLINFAMWLKSKDTSPNKHRYEKK